MSEKLRNPKKAEQPPVKSKISPTVYMMAWEATATSISTVE